ncbi:type II toxin-antitoxin system VapC family toxin [Alcaligenaceae bacterium B3P038]|nr:type II toxin-antitoxin system VapC family toxin [Alcaligenaceae bacterium B3P038]
MILVDSSIWIDHLRSSDDLLIALLEAREVLVHPFVIGELALGSLSQRTIVLDYLENLPAVNVATPSEIAAFIEGNALFGLGIGYVDVSLLASVRLTPGSTLLTRDKRLGKVAVQLGLVAKTLH